MKLTVLTWLRDSSIVLLGRTIEIIFRIILFLTPLGVFLLLIQMRDKASTIRTISVYTEDGSVWQHIFPWFILVSVDPKSFKKSSTKIRNKISFWAEIMEKRMLLLTKMDTRKILINTRSIQTIESNPDTVIILSGGRKLLVKESLEEIWKLIQEG